MYSLWLSISILLILIFVVTALILLLLIPYIIARSPFLIEKTLFTTGGEATDSSYYDSQTVPGVRNFYVTLPNQTNEKNKKKIIIGVYHFLPRDYANETEDQNIPLDKYEQLLKESPYHVLLLFHGRGQSRASFSNKYILLSSIFHVIVFDYRCFGDSTKADLTEEALVGDCVSLYKWLQERTSSSIYVWGQSLGSALCIETIYLLDKENIFPKGMILESSFTNIREAIKDSPAGRLFSWIPGFSNLLDSYGKHGFLFDSSLYLKNIRCPVMIMHAADDDIIPFHQGLKMYEVVMTRRIQVNIAKFLPIDAKFNCGHDFIYNFPNFTDEITNFIGICEDEFNITSEMT